LKINIIAHPNAKKTKIETDMFGALHVYVDAPALEGKANKKIITTLAQHFNKKNNQVILIKGNKSKNKIFEIF